MARQRIDEIAGGEYPDEQPRPIGPGANRMNWNPGNPGVVPINRNPRFDVPGPQERPQLNYMGNGDLDAILDQIAAEQALPPHKKNAAKIGALKQQAQEIARRLESQWVQRNADLMLPRIDEGQPGED